LNKTLSLTESTLETILQGYLGNTYNMFIVKCNLVGNISAGVEANIIFYKYIQRSRIVKSRRLLLLIAAGVFKNKPPLVHIRMSQGFMLPLSVVNNLELMLQNAFTQDIRLNFFNIGQIANTNFSKLDQNVIQSIRYFMSGQEKRLAQTKGAQA